MCDLLNLFNINVNSDIRRIGFADDLILYSSNKCLLAAKDMLQTKFRQICKYFRAWKLEVNNEKCETKLLIPF